MMKSWAFEWTILVIVIDTILVTAIVSYAQGYRHGHQGLMPVAGIESFDPTPTPCPCVERFRPGAWDCSGAPQWMPDPGINTGFGREGGEISYYIEGERVESETWESYRAAEAVGRAARERWLRGRAEATP